MTAIGDERWVILVGVDFYMPGTRPIKVRNLKGGVRDIARVEEYFTTRLGVPSSRIIKLTATCPPQEVDEDPSENASQWPTHENIIAALQKVTLEASKGDSVYFHYSGHGGRVATIFDSLKGKGALDEVLVPTNIKRSEGRYLRDIELAALINNMIKKNLVVTVVLDSCHSAGATRQALLDSASTRALDEDDSFTPQSKTSPIPYEQIAQAWEQERKGTSGENWLLEPRGYTLLAACRANETAKETIFDGDTYGVFTYWLLDSLERAWPQQTYQMLHHRIRAKIYCHDQTPILAGEGDRMFFGIDRVKPVFSVNVLALSSPRVGGLITIDAGQAHGININTEFALYPRDVSDFADAERRIAIAKVNRVQDVRSTGKLTVVFDTKQTLESGCQAIVLRGRNTLQKKYVKIIEQDNLDASIDQATALHAVRTMLETDDDILAEKGERSDDITYLVTVNSRGEYEIRNSTGVLIPHLPALKIELENGAERLTKRLKHLAIYNSVLNLENPDSTSLLANMLKVRILGKLPAYESPPDPKLGEINSPAPLVRLQSLGGGQGLPEVFSREWVIMRIENLASCVVNIAVLDLEASWAITQIYPSSDGTDFETLDAGQYLDLPLQMTIPESLKLDSGQVSIVDIIKIFATVEPTSFRWLQLPDIDQDQEHESRASQPSNPLEKLQAAISSLNSWRLESRENYRATKWITEQITIRTRRD